MQKNIGIDIGGTKIRIGVIDGKAHILAMEKLPMQHIPAGQMIGRICDAAERMLEKAGLCMEEIGGVGIGVPGTVDHETGAIEYCPNIGWTGQPAGKYFRGRWNKNIAIDQDSRLAALGEALYGAGRGYGSIACITLGTGIGCGVVMDGKIFRGGMNTAGELGHICVEPGGRRCACGNRGCLERYCSGTGILLGARERFSQKLDAGARTEDVFEMAYGGDGDALALIADCVRILAQGIVALVNVLSPEAVILSGGLCAHEKLLVEPLKERVYAQGYPAWTNRKKLAVKKAELGEYAPLVGAAAIGTGA
ncbi:ROK family protein [Christensenella timonensis]|uniref:ROK family protein n=1 Tax=Christensenella timonensis TaxID=1816678 RepID=UPI00082F6A4F|nr:ROK family protein [Christensenella timonensis]